MLKVSEASTLALHAMVVLAEYYDSTISVGEIAETLHVSETHLAKVLQRLARGGLVKSMRGPRGGFSLTRNPKDTTLLEIYETIEGTLTPPKCLLALPVCNGKCILGDLLEQVDVQIRQYFAQTRLSGLRGTFPKNKTGSPPTRQQRVNRTDKVLT